MSDDAYDYGELIVLQHDTLAGPSNLTPSLEGRAARRPWRRIRLDEGEPVPELTPSVRGILTLGGGMGVADRDEHAWMAPELDLLKAATNADVPVLGICLGAQLLATALGGEVDRRPRPEIGLPALTRTAGAEDDDVFAGWPDGARTLMVHKDEVVRLPDGAVAMLQGSDGVPAWRTGNGTSYGVQFHPETSTDLLAVWLEQDDVVEMFAAAGVDPDEFTEEATRRAPFLRAVGVALVGRWLDSVVGADDPTPRRGKRG